MEDLFFRVQGEGKPLIILHGLFGTADNWQTIAKVLSQQFTVYTIDQRNHGRSFRSPIWHYEAMAEDLQLFIEKHQIENPHLIGHSMGGKTLMCYTAQYAKTPFDKLIIVDIAPRYYPIHHQTILAGLNAIPLSQIQSRQEADQILTQYIKEGDTRQFLLKNLYRDEQNQFQWRMNLPVIAQNIEKVGEALPEKYHALATERPTLFIRGEKSDYIQEKDFTLIQQAYPNVQIVTIENAGHWVHAEQPQTFIQTVLSFLLPSS
ncbi:MAG: alpha/beta fold hydrolase [Cytophagales bacterium]|nr:MAG: alpha/beta fold hydrolase [Cytophagales bacterium]